MALQTSDFAGDAVYCYEATGDCVVGDEVCFDRATFSGSYKSPKFAGFERIEGTIVADSYGDQKQQHTFTLHLVSGSRLMIKGRNLYANRTFRKPWTDEAARRQVLSEKHQRGANARYSRSLRIEPVQELSR